MQADSSHHRARLQTAWIGALGVLAASAMLLHGLNSYSMWLDEVRMVLPTLAWDPLKLSTWLFRPGHPPLYFLLLRGWITLTGQTDYGMRVLSGLLGVLTIAVIIRIGKDLSKTLFAGVAAALLFGAMGMVRYYVHETHNYALLLLACMALLLFFERWWARPGRRAYVIGAVAATAGVMYTHYYGAYFVLAILLFVVVAGWRRARDIWRWVGIQAMAGVLYLPMLGVLLGIANRILGRLALKHSGGKVNRTANAINTAMTTRWNNIVISVETLLSSQLVVFGILLAAGIVGIVLLARARRGGWRETLPPVLLLAVVVIGCMAIPLTANLLYRTFTARRILYVLPVLALLIGVMLAGLPRYVREAVPIVAAALIFTAGYSTFLPGDWGFRRIMQDVAAGYQPGDLIFIQAPQDGLAGLPLTYYAHTLMPHASVLTLDEGGLSSDDSRRQFVSQTFQTRVLARNSFWVVSATDPDYGEDSLSWVSLLDRHWMQKTVDRVSLFSLNHYTAQGQQRLVLDGKDVSSTLGLPVTFGRNQFELDKAVLSQDTAHPGDEITIWLDWRALRPPDQDYALFVHLLKGEALVAQQDGDPLHLGRPYPTTLWPVAAVIYDTRRLTIPPGTPTGAYRLVVGLYSRASGARLQVEPAETTIDRLVLEAIEVVNP